MGTTSHLKKNLSEFPGKKNRDFFSCGAFLSRVVGDFIEVS